MKVIITLLMLTLCLPTHGRVLVKEKKNRFKQSEAIKEGSTGRELKTLRRVAVGVQALGALGLGGVQMELNFNPKWAGTIGFGGGSGFRALEVQAKHVLAGEWLLPYATFGYTRWESTRNLGRIDKTTPSILGERILTDGERASGEFSKDLFYTSFGLQLMQLKGKWAGYSIYAEGIILVDFSTFVASPTGTLGMLYYF